MPQGKQKCQAHHNDADKTMRCPYCGMKLIVEIGKTREATLIQHYKLYPDCAEDYRRSRLEQYLRTMSLVSTNGAT